MLPDSIHSFPAPKRYSSRPAFHRTVGMQIQVFFHGTSQGAKLPAAKIFTAHTRSAAPIPPKLTLSCRAYKSSRMGPHVTRRYGKDPTVQARYRLMLLQDGVLAEMSAQTSKYLFRSARFVYKADTINKSVICSFRVRCSTWLTPAVAHKFPATHRAFLEADDFYRDVPIQKGGKG